MSLPRLSRKCLVLSALAFVSALPGCKEKGAAELARGNLAASQRRFDQALAAYRAAADAQPKKARPRELLGHVLFELKRLPEARSAYESALAAEPGAALEAEVGLARIDAQEGKTDAALQRLEAVLGRVPANVPALVARANLLLKRGAAPDLERALADTRKALAAEPHHAAALYTRGCAHLAARRFDEAAETFDHLREAHPSLPLAFYGYARLASAREDKVATLVNLRQARERASATTGWNARDVQADPAFQFLREDADFRAVVGTP